MLYPRALPRHIPFQKYPLSLNILTEERSHGPNQAQPDAVVGWLDENGMS